MDPGYVFAASLVGICLALLVFIIWLAARRVPKTRKAHSFWGGCRNALLAVALVLVIGLGGFFGLVYLSIPRDLNDTWTWDGNDWRQAQTNSAPPWREGAVFVYSDASSVVLLFGGYGGNGNVFGDTWTFDGTHWAQQHSTNGPRAGFSGVAGYDPAGRQVIMFGGRAETWSWSDGDWRQLEPVTSPPGSSWWDDLLFDPLEHRLTLFGGHIRGGNWVPETWVWDKSNWTEVQSSGAPSFFCCYPRGHRVNIRYVDSNAGVIKSVAFHPLFTPGHGPSPTAQSWSGSSWIGDQPVVWTPVTAGGGNSFFPPKRYLLTFGVCNNRDVPRDDETWTWDGTVWTRLHPKTNPPARSTTYLAYVKAKRSVVMFGGNSSLVDCG